MSLISHYNTERANHGFNWQAEICPAVNSVTWRREIDWMSAARHDLLLSTNTRAEKEPCYCN